MNTSIIIPLGIGSKWNNTELRYCLRSVEKYLKGYGDIFLIGEKPSWIRNVIHIPFDEGPAPQSYEKERNIFNKIMAACADERVTDNFLFMNDDHFLREIYVAGLFPYYYDGYLKDKMTITEYKHTVKNTVQRIGTVPFYADVHCPIRYNKRSFQKLANYDWSVRHGYCIKTLYCHNHVAPHYMTQRTDCKLDEVQRSVDGRPWFSIGDKAFNWDVQALLKELYPHKSSYEH